VQWEIPLASNQIAIVKKSLQLTAAFIIAMSALHEASSQSNPAPFPLAAESYTFNSWSPEADPGTYPPNMIFHIFPGGDPELTDEPSGDWVCRYDIESRSRIVGLFDDGVGFINTGNIQDDQDRCGNGPDDIGGYVGAAVVALNASGRENINLHFTLGIVSQGSGDPTPRECAITLQYRVGAGATWNNLEEPVVFSSAGREPGDSETFQNILLPAICNNQPVVQVRWKYYFVAQNDGGSRPMLRLDDVEITSSELTSAPDPIITADTQQLEFLHQLFGTPSVTKTVLIQGLNLTGNVLVTAPQFFEVSDNPDNNFDEELMIPSVSGQVEPVNIYIRLNRPSLGPASGVVTVSSPGAESADIFVDGVCMELPELFINEFMAINSETIADETGAFEDWFEIFNPNNFDVDIAGYYVTDNLNNPFKHKMAYGSPETVVPANGFLLLWASGNPDVGVLHVDWALSGSGESLGIYFPDGETAIDTYTFGQQTADISEGRATDGADEWVFFDTPTPGASNNSVGIHTNHKVQLTVYPVPATDFLNLQCDCLIESVNLLDLSGRAVGHYSGLLGSFVTFPLDNLTSGLYLLQTHTNKGVVTSRVMVR